MKINDIYESTTSGSVATVAQPMTTQARNASIYGGKKGGNLLTGKKTSKKYANSIAEAAGEFKGEHVTVLYIDDKPAVKYTDITKAKKEMEILKRKLPSSKKLELKQEVREAGMPQSVLRNKQKLAKMTDAELADHLKGKSDDELKRLAWRHGYGNMSSHYVNRIKKVTEPNKKPVQEGKMKELAMDMRDMDNGNFQKKYKKSKEQLKRILGDPDKKPVQESVDYPGIKDDEELREFQKYPDAFSLYNKLRKDGVTFTKVHPRGKNRVDFDIVMSDRRNSLIMSASSGAPWAAMYEERLEEDDLILVPGQGHRLKSGFIPHGESRLDHEVEMAKSDLFSAAKNAKQVYEMIADVSEEEGLEGWVQEKIIKANDYLNTIREYLEGKQLQEMTGGVIAGGGVGEGIVDKIKGVVRREKAKDMPLVQTRRDYAMSKGGEAYNKGETRKGNQYMAYAEKDRKKAGDPSNNPAGTYRAKTSDYSSKTIDEGIEDWDMRIQSLPKTSELKLKAITATSPGPTPKRYTFDTEKEAIQHFGPENWQFIKSGAPNKYGESWKVEYKNDATNEGVFNRFKNKTKKPSLNLPSWPDSNSANEWMAKKVAYYAQHDPENLPILFSPATGDYLPISVHTGSSWKPEHLKFYRELKKKYPDAVKKAKDITTGIAGTVSLSKVGDSEDFYGMSNYKVKPKLTDSADPFSKSFGQIRYALSPGIAKEYGIDGDTYHKLAKMAMEAKQWMERGLHFDQVVRKMNIPDRLKQTIRDGVYDIRSMAFIMGVQQYQEEQNSVKEGRVLGRGMSPEARARDIEQSDIEYIEQRQFKDKWKKDNPGKPWPGYEKAGRYK
jgi:hypothetical protein